MKLKDKIIGTLATWFLVRYLKWNAKSFTQQDLQEFRNYLLYEKALKKQRGET